jgi:hypothetical protein
MPMEPMWLQCTCAGDLPRCVRCGSRRIRELANGDRERLTCTDCSHVWDAAHAATGEPAVTSQPAAARDVASVAVLQQHRLR